MTELHRLVSAVAEIAERIQVGSGQTAYRRLVWKRS